MRTLLISDLHLGSRSRSDLLRDPAIRAPLLEVAADVDRVVLLGDVLELRHGPPREALAEARDFFSELGRAVAGGEVVVVAGNHDHALLEPWLARRAVLDGSGPIGVEQLIAPAQASAMVERIAEWVAPARTLAAYPGLWVREDVYATHGHYLDCHLTVPTLERLSIAAMSRLLGLPASRFSGVDDYEAVTAPVYVWRDAVAREVPTGDALNGNATLRAWRALDGAHGSSAPASGRDGSRRAEIVGKLRTRALVAAFPLAVAALNRAGLGPLRSEISARELRRAGLRAMHEVASRLGLGDAYVVFGHTHRAGPLARDHAEEWHLDGPGARLINTGCWTYDSVFLTATPGESPYWPGTCVLVEDAGPPELKRLLLDYGHEQLRAMRSAARAAS